ncbi:MAG: Ig-like domain-containing protein [Ardenticatenaceae bacterium]|nr:hypothetical protein [Anaerolineales bacterium]MCB8922372.1 Ig-like domain-containing protein [Ardenticatenaceae bacterium]MCB8991304.1 Ig-like domain-containing protein [Ardenticatenaceae bacterium]
MKHRLSLSLLLILLLPASLLAQEDDSLSLKLSRDFGYNSGIQIQGRFSYRVTGPDDLERVVFLLDGEPIGEDTEAPFRLQFQTDTYAIGTHTMSAVGYTSNGRELSSNRITREFVGKETTNRIIYWIVIPIVVLSLAGRIFASWFVNRGRRETGKPAISESLGGTICPNCNRPYAIHLWSLKLIVARLDRCPHCGKWKFVRRVPYELLEAADKASEAADAANNTPPFSTNSEDKFLDQLDNSRFDDDT